MRADEPRNCSMELAAPKRPASTDTASPQRCGRGWKPASSQPLSGDSTDPHARSPRQCPSGGLPSPHRSAPAQCALALRQSVEPLQGHPKGAC